MKLGQLIQSRKGQVESVRITGVVAVTLIIIVLIVFRVRNSIDQDSFTADQNTTLDNIDTNVYGGLELYGLAVIVAAAALILGLLGGF